MLLLLLWLRLRLMQERNNLLPNFLRKVRLVSSVAKVLVLLVGERVDGWFLTIVNAFNMASQIGHLVSTVGTMRAPERSLSSVHNYVSLIQLVASWPTEDLGAVRAREGGRSSSAPTTTTTTAAALLVWGSSTLQDTRQL